MIVVVAAVTASGFAVVVAESVVVSTIVGPIKIVVVADVVAVEES